MAISNTSICNQALAKLGAKRINNLETDTSVPAIQCRTHYEPTRDALLRSYSWRFARARATLSQDTVTPDFEWSFQYHLPNDFMLMRSIYEGRFSSTNFRNYDLEDDLLLTDEDEMKIRYVKKVTDPTKFDPLFVKLFTWLLADEMIGPLAGGDDRIQKKIDRALAILTPTARALDGQETNTAGRAESVTWNDARFGDNIGFPMRY